MKGYRKIIAFGLTAFMVANSAFGMGTAMPVSAEETGNGVKDASDLDVNIAAAAADVSGNDADMPGSGADVSGNDADVPGSDADVSVSGAGRSGDLSNGLIGYYTFDNTLDNSAGNGEASVHGGAGDTWNAPAAGQAAYGEGKNGQAYSFTGDSGAGESLVRGEGLQLDVKMPAEYTVSYWVNPNTVNSATSMVFVPIDLNNGLNIADNWFGPTFPTVRIWGPLATSAVINAETSEHGSYMDNWIESADALCEQWTYITLTGDAEGNNVLYINGGQVATGSSIAGAFEGMDIFLGINFWDVSFDGLMDDVAIYSRALSAAEVSALYQKNGVPTDSGDVPEVPEAPYVEHVSVHDPSIIKDEATGMYYVFGTHRAWARSKDLITWQTFTNNLNDVKACETIFENEIAWSAMGDSTYSVEGNMWAPDVIWNETMGKWCMYMSINGCSWNSTICLLTADSLDGDWAYVGPVVYSGFTSEATHDYTKTDYSKVTGDTALDARYAMNSYTCIGNDGKTPTAPTTWNTNYGAHAIDPCIVVGEDGTWYMSYGSWSGGIYMIQLDKATGLRDYNVTYAYEANKSDPYMGYHIAGGNFASGEASYIRKMGDYYYLYVTLGGLTSTGGYNMRVFRSENITGPYVDYSGDDARQQTGNYNSTVGNRVMSGYKWSFMPKGYVAQGHNSVMTDADGRMYLFNHYRFDDGSEEFEMRVHQVFVNEEGWLVTAPFEYKGEKLSADVTKEAVAGTYEVLFHKLDIDYEHREVVTGETFSLNADGTVTSNRSGSWEAAGTWDFSAEGAPYVTMAIGNTTYKGVFVEQQMEGLKDTTWCFTLLGSDEISVWGYKILGSDKDMVESAISNLSMPEGTFIDLTLPTVAGAATISWESSAPDVLGNDGKVTAPKADTKVTLTAAFRLNTTTVKKEYPITVYAPQSSTESKVLATYFTGEKVDLTDAAAGTYQYANPFYDKTTKGLQIYNGISVKFDLEAAAGADQWLRNIVGFNAGDKGGLYFTGNSYLGYNATGGFFDANIKNGDFADLAWQWGTDFLKDSAAVEIRILPVGFEVYVDGELAYNQDSVEPYEQGKTEYTVPGSINIDLYSHVLTYLQNSASYLNFGWGSWWDGGYCGTISNVVLSALPVDDMNASDVTVGTWNVNRPGELAWYDYSNFFGLEGTGDFTLNWKFRNYNPGDGNWRNFAIAVTTDMDRTTESDADWYLRADAYSNAVFGGGNDKVTYEFDWAWDNFIALMNGADIDATLVRSGTDMTFTAVIVGSDGKTYHYKAAVADAPTEDVMVYLGGENCYLVINDYTGKPAEPTTEPTAEPTTEPTAEPTTKPTAEPTTEPTAEPTSRPTTEPTTQPTESPAPTKAPTDSGKPFIKGESGKDGWDAIKEEAAKASAGGQIRVNMNGVSVVPGDVVESMRGKDVTLELDMGNGIIWCINGSSITAQNVNDVDLAVTYIDSVPQAVVEAVAGNRQSIQFSIAHNGDFGYSAVLRIKVDKENAGLYANLFYYNDVEKSLAFVCASQVAEDGAVELTFTHASSYVIVLGETAMGSGGGASSGGNDGEGSGSGGNQQEKDAVSPKTGEAGGVSLQKEPGNGSFGRVLMAGAAVSAMAGFAAFLIRRRAEKHK